MNRLIHKSRSFYVVPIINNKGIKSVSPALIGVKKVHEYCLYMY